MSRLLGEFSPGADMLRQLGNEWSRLGRQVAR